MKVVYEVNLKVDRKIETNFQSWLVGHIQDVLAIDGFESANWFDSTDEDDKSSNKMTITMHYHMRDQAALDSYLEKHAARLRQPAKDLFGDQFSATRRMLGLVKSF